MVRDIAIVAGSALCIVAFIWFARSMPSDSSALDVPAARAAFLEDIRREGGIDAYRAFKETYAHSEFDRAHNAAHIFGESLFDVLGIGGVRVCDQNFNFGCYHGFFTKAVGAEGLQVVAELDGACREFESPTACQHGIGHGILEYVGHTRLADALEACKKTHQPDPLAGCTSGVFMEYNVPLSVSGDGSFALAARPLENPDEPYAPCPKVSEEFRSSCYHELPQWWAQVYGKDFKKLGDLCAEAGDYARSCFEGLGNILASFAEYDAQKAIEFCGVITDAGGKTECLLNSSWSVFNEGGDARGASEVCEKLPKEEQAKCPKQL